MLKGDPVMKKEFHKENRETLYKSLESGSLALLFSGHAPRKTGDEDYPFFANRNFVYLTGIEQQDSILLSMVQGNETKEVLFLLPSDLMAER